MMLLLSSALSERYYEIFRCTRTDSAATVSPRLNLVLFKENNACGFVCPLIWWNSSHFSSQQGKDIYQLTGSSAGKKNIPYGLHATLWLLLPWCARKSFTSCQGTDKEQSRYHTRQHKHISVAPEGLYIPSLTQTGWEHEEITVWDQWGRQVLFKDFINKERQHWSGQKFSDLLISYQDRDNSSWISEVHIMVWSNL